MDKVLGWIIKGASVVVTVPATVNVAGSLFADVPFGLRIVVQIAAVMLVEGVFLYSWIRLERDKSAEFAYKLRHALTASGLYVGLWVLALAHGEGPGGIVFRVALGAALLGTVYDAGVYDVLRNNRRTERNISQAWKVKRVTRKLAIGDAVLQRECDSEFTQAKILAEHKRRMARVDEKPAPRMEPPVDKHESVPVVERGRGVTPKRKRSKADRALAVLRANPTVTLRQLGDEIGVSHTTAGRYIERLVEQGKVRDANGSGYEVLV